MIKVTRDCVPATYLANVNKKLPYIHTNSLGHIYSSYIVNPPYSEDFTFVFS